jgi:hypothetical protein
VPHRRLDIRRDDRCHARPTQDLAERCHAGAAPVIAFPHQQGRVEAAPVLDMAGRHARTHDPATPPEDRLGAHHRGELRRRLHPVLQRDHARVWADQRREGARYLGELPRLHPDDDHIHRADLGGVIGDQPGLDHEVALGAVHP